MIVRGPSRSLVAEGGLFAHSIVCFPFLDLRFLIQAGLRPGWLDGEFTSVGSLGRVVRNFRDGTEAEIRVNAALIFGDELTRNHLKLRSRNRGAVDVGNGLSISSRRILADGEGQVRLELQTRDAYRGDVAIENRLDQLLTTPVYVVRESQTELISAGFYVAKLYLSQSDKTTFPQPSATTVKLLQEGAGSPFVVVVYPKGVGSDPDGTPLKTLPAGIGAVTCRLIELAGKTTGVWQIWGASEVDWLPTVRMLCRIICQLSEVATLINLQQDSNAIFPHLLDNNALNHFFRVRSGQLRRAAQGGWSVPEVQTFAAQHLKVSIDESAQMRDNLTLFLRRDTAGDVAKTLERITRDSKEYMILKDDDRRLVTDLLAAEALNERDYFRRLVSQANLPLPFKQQLQNSWTGNIQQDAFSLVDWAIAKRTNPADSNFTVLASLLLPEIKNLGIEDAATIVAIISNYRLIRNESLLTNLQTKYQCPIDILPHVSPKVVGPEITWRGNTDPVELQSWLQRATGFLDVGYLRKAIKHASSVCLVEVGANGRTGTGVAIHDQFVLTNYHVIEGVMQADKPGPDANSIMLKFGSYGGDAACHEVRVDAGEPIVAYSPTDKLDYALLKVPQLPTLADVSVAQRTRSDPSVNSFMSILQHPHGGGMQLTSSLDAITFRDSDAGIIQYIAKTASGSSGAPCFDENWNLVAIHHAERSRPFGTIREGILLSAIEKEIGKWLY